METLKTLRPNSAIYIYNKPVYNKDDIPNLTTIMYQFDDETDIDTLVKDGTVKIYHKPVQIQDNIIIVKKHSDDIINTVLNEIDETLSSHLFFSSELDIDPTNNCMVPKHRLATQEEISNLKQKKIKISTLPVIKIKDPIRRWHNFPFGSIIAIEREGLYFRKVEED